MEVLLYGLVVVYSGSVAYSVYMVSIIEAIVSKVMADATDSDCQQIEFV